MKLRNFPLGEKVKTSFVFRESCSGVFQRDGFSSGFFTWFVAVLQSAAPDGAELPSALQQLTGSSGAARPMPPEPFHAIYSKTETPCVSPGPPAQHHKSTSTNSSNLFVYQGKKVVC